MTRREVLDQLERMIEDVRREMNYLGLAENSDHEVRRFLQGKKLALHVAHDLVDDLDD